MKRRHVASLGGLVLAMQPASAMAESVGGSVTSFGISDWLGLMLRLGLVVGVIWAAVYAMRWYTRRVGGERGGAAHTLDIVETRSLGPNRALHLVRIGGRAVLIGVTPERINPLLEIDDPEVLGRLELTADGVSRPAATFGALLAGLGAAAGVSKSVQALAPEGPVPASAGLDVLRSRLRGMTAPAMPRQPRRPLMDRTMALLGFMPVESLPQMVERIRAARTGTPATSTIMMTPPAHAAPVLTPRGASAPPASLPVIAPSATQALRALSGYRVTQQSSEAEPAGLSGRDERIAEAQRAIAAARQQAG